MTAKLLLCEHVCGKYEEWGNNGKEKSYWKLPMLHSWKNSVSFAVVILMATAECHHEFRGLIFIIIINLKYKTEFQRKISTFKSSNSSSFHCLENVYLSSWKVVSVPVFKNWLKIWLQVFYLLSAHDQIPVWVLCWKIFWHLL